MIKAVPNNSYMLKECSLVSAANEKCEIFVDGDPFPCGRNTLSFEMKRIFGRFNGKRGNTRTIRKVLIKAGVRTNDGA